MQEHWCRLDQNQNCSNWDLESLRLPRSWAQTVHHAVLNVVGLVPVAQPPHECGPKFCKSALIELGTAVLARNAKDDDLPATQSGRMSANVLIARTKPTLAAPPTGRHDLMGKVVSPVFRQATRLPT